MEVLVGQLEECPYGDESRDSQEIEPKECLKYAIVAGSGIWDFFFHDCNWGLVVAITESEEQEVLVDAVFVLVGDKATFGLHA